MAEEPEQVPPQKRRAAFVPCKLAVDGNQRHKKAGAEIPVHQKHDACRKKHTERQQSDNDGAKPGPHPSWSPPHVLSLWPRNRPAGKETPSPPSPPNHEPPPAW